MGKSHVEFVFLLEIILRKYNYHAHESVARQGPKQCQGQYDSKLLISLLRNFFPFLLLRSCARLRQREMSERMLGQKSCSIILFDLCYSEQVQGGTTNQNFTRP